MKHHVSTMRTEGPDAHPHLHSFMQRIHGHTMEHHWVEKHITLLSLVITGLIAALVAAFLMMFHAYQTTGAWQLF